jgi:hypothetical protein
MYIHYTYAGTLTNRLIHKGIIKSGLGVQWLQMPGNLFGIEEPLSMLSIFISFHFIHTLGC